jgi:hypothetical protein
MSIARVFPRRTSMTPADKDAYVGLPDLFTPQYDEVHISVTFTWDKAKAEELIKGWSRYGNVKCGGCAYDDMGGSFTGLYTRKGVTITSRGCPNACGFCFVPKREGKIRELPIVAGNIIQDNNLTACSRSHIDNVFKMLSKQKGVVFQGGVESARVDDYFVDKLRSISLKEVWLAYDHDNADKPLKMAVNRLSKYFKRDKIRCYVLIGYGQDTIEKAEIRLRKAWEIGTLPFAMLYRDEKNTPHTKDWKIFQRQWTRPAIIKTMMKVRNP